MASKDYSAGILAKIGQMGNEAPPAVAKNTSDVPEPPNSGGITVSADLLPGVKEGDEVTMVVNRVDEAKNEVHLSIKS